MGLGFKLPASSYINDEEETLSKALEGEQRGIVC